MFVADLNKQLKESNTELKETKDMKREVEEMAAKFKVYI